MIAAQIENGIVVNMIVVNDIADLPELNLVAIPVGFEGGIGWSYAGGEFYPPVAE